MSMRDKAQRNRPTVAGVATGLVVALGEWGLDAVPASVPGDVTTQLQLAVLVAAGIVGGAAGRLAQRHTWSEDSHVAVLKQANRGDGPIPDDHAGRDAA